MSLMKSIISVAFGTSLSRVVGFIRDILIAKFLGASMMADAFFCCVKIPKSFQIPFCRGNIECGICADFGWNYAI